jgi:hypothetical protein
LEVRLFYSSCRPFSARKRQEPGRYLSCIPAFAGFKNLSSPGAHREGRLEEEDREDEGRDMVGRELDGADRVMVGREEVLVIRGEEGRAEGAVDRIVGRELDGRDTLPLEGRLSWRGADTEGIRGGALVTVPLWELGRATLEAYRLFADWRTPL